jgi:hypothetical protein
VPYLWPTYRLQVAKDLEQSAVLLGNTSRTWETFKNASGTYWEHTSNTRIQTFCIPVPPPPPPPPVICKGNTGPPGCMLPLLIGSVVFLFWKLVYQHLDVLSGGPPFPYLIFFVMLQEGVRELDVPHPLRRFICLLWRGSFDEGPSILSVVFPLFWVLWFIGPRPHRDRDQSHSIQLLEVLPY